MHLLFWVPVAMQDALGGLWLYRIDAYQHALSQQWKIPWLATILSPGIFSTFFMIFR